MALTARLLSLSLFSRIKIMSNVPDVKIGEEIEIGARKPISLRAIVYSINHERIFPYDIEVVYLQDDYKPVKQEVIWDGKMWQFNNSNGITLQESEGYEFVKILKN